MHSSEREEFETHLGTLCAGFNVPMTELRTDAYWRGLQQMSALQFARVVEHALSERGPERIPTVPQVWNLHRELRRTARAPAPSPSSSPPPAFDSFHAFGQRCLLRFLSAAGAVPDDVVPRLVAEKNRLAANFRSVAAECEVTAEEVREAMFAGFARVAGKPAVRVE